MSKTVSWKIWYDNGKHFSSVDGSAEEAPLDGVLVIVEKKADRDTTIHEGRDYYYWNGQNWVSGYVASLEKWLRSILPNLKYGLWTKDGIFKEAMEDANRWP